MVVPPAGIIGSSSDGSGGDAEGSAAAAADEAAATSTSGGDAGISGAEGGVSIIEDILRLQARCEAAMQRQQALGDRLLRRALVHTSAAGLPGQNTPKQPQQPAQQQQQEQGEQPQRRRTQAMLKQEWLRQQPWYVDWETRLSQVRLPAV